MSEILYPTIYKDDNWELFLETHPYYKLIIHCYVYNWSKKNYKQFLLVWEELLVQLKLRNYSSISAAIRAEDRKLMKFSEMFGFEDTGVRLSCPNKEVRGIFTCSI